MSLHSFKVIRYFSPGSPGAFSGIPIIRSVPHRSLALIHTSIPFFPLPPVSVVAFRYRKSQLLLYHSRGKEFLPIACDHTVSLTSLSWPMCPLENGLLLPWMQQTSLGSCCLSRALFRRQGEDYLT